MSLRATGTSLRVCASAQMNQWKLSLLAWAVKNSTSITLCKCYNIWASAPQTPWTAGSTQPGGLKAHIPASFAGSWVYVETVDSTQGCRSGLIGNLSSLLYFRLSQLSHHNSPSISHLFGFHRKPSMCPLYFETSQFPLQKLAMDPYHSGTSWCT